MRPLKILNTKIIDVIVSDYQLPDMDGITLLKTLRNTGSRIPFIVFTGRSREQVVIEALNNGADFFPPERRRNRGSSSSSWKHMILQATSRKRAEDAFAGINPQVHGHHQFPARCHPRDRPGRKCYCMEPCDGGADRWSPAHHILGSKRSRLLPCIFTAGGGRS